MTTENIDVPIGKCEQCGADIWKSMITGNLIKSCNCPRKKKIEQNIIKGGEKHA